MIIQLGLKDSEWELLESVGNASTTEEAKKGWVVVCLFVCFSFLDLVVVFF